MTVMYDIIHPALIGGALGFVSFLHLKVKALENRCRFNEKHIAHLERILLLRKTQ